LHRSPKETKIVLRWNLHADLQFCEATGRLTRRFLHIEVRVTRDPLRSFDLGCDRATDQWGVGLQRNGREVTAMRAVHD
jgi:hypothetical protein